MNDELAVLFAKRFIQRRDVKAVQFNSGAYVPDRELKNRQTGEPDPGRFGPYGFQMNHLHQHLNGEATYGHYLLDNESNTRMFAFDIDLKKTGSYSLMLPPETGESEADWEARRKPIALGDPTNSSDSSLRDAWLDRGHPARAWIKTQMGMLARKFAAAITKELDIPCAAAYSGNKGIHVYGFTGSMPAVSARQAATYVIDSTDDWELERGQHQYRHKLQDPEMGYPNFSVEVFPKQDNLDGKDLGNLMRLPLGKNLKSSDPTFFLDLTTAPGVMAPHKNPVQLLETGDPFQ